VIKAISKVVFIGALALCRSVVSNEENSLVLEPKYKIDIVANFSLDSLVPTGQILKDAQLKLRAFWLPFGNYIDCYYDENVKKILIMNPIAYGCDFNRIPKEKLILFSWEPEGASAEYYEKFSHVYTYNDHLIDGIKYHKFFYPVLLPMMKNLLPFEQRKLCVLVSYRSTPARIKMVHFFETTDPDDFDLYGFQPIVNSNRYRGSIPGSPWGDDKLSLLNNYRFCVCFENSYIEGYVTEKIFACFAAGCIPIYYGAPNIETYIPKDCYIDYRDFKTDEELYQFLKTMPKERYEEYLSHIRAYLQSEKAQLFSIEHFNQIIREAAGLPRLDLLHN